VAHLLIRHRVQDFAKWKAEYDGHRSVRVSAGLKDLDLWHNVDDAKEVFLLFEVADVAKAKAFVTSADLKQTMTRAGVVGAPDISFLSGD